MRSALASLAVLALAAGCSSAAAPDAASVASATGVDWVRDLERTPLVCQPSPVRTTALAWESVLLDPLWDRAGVVLVELGAWLDDPEDLGSTQRVELLGVEQATGRVVGRAVVPVDLYACFAHKHGEAVIPYRLLPLGNLRGDRPVVRGSPNFDGLGRPFPPVCVPQAFLDRQLQKAPEATVAAACVEAAPRDVTPDRPPFGIGR